MDLKKWLHDNNVTPHFYLLANDKSIQFSKDAKLDDICNKSMTSITAPFGIYNDGHYDCVTIPMDLGHEPDVMGLNELLPYDKNEEHYIKNEREFESNLVSFLKVNVPYMNARIESYVLNGEGEIAYRALKQLDAAEFDSLVAAAGFEPGDSFKQVLLNEVNEAGYNLTNEELFDKYRYEYVLAERAKLITNAKDALKRENLDSEFWSIDQVQVYTKDDIIIDCNLNDNEIIITSAGGLSSDVGRTFKAAMDKFGNVEPGLLPVKPCREVNHGISKLNFFTEHQLELTKMWEANSLNLDPKQIEYDGSLGVLKINVSSLSEQDKENLWTKNVDTNRFEPLNENPYAALFIPGTVMLEEQAKEYNDIAEANEQVSSFELPEYDMGYEL